MGSFLGPRLQTVLFPSKTTELPLYAMLFVIASPHQVVKLRGTQTGSGIGGNLMKGFEQGSILATVGIIGITLAPLMLLIGSNFMNE
ncbi:hypothetical protein MKX01_000858 [Papaver californicum]|nr:hypothetical protein MKX01_000858 [Papaver californicum]